MQLNKMFYKPALCLLFLYPAVLIIGRAPADICASLIAIFSLLHWVGHPHEMRSLFTRRDVLAVFGFWLGVLLATAAHMPGWGQWQITLGYLRFPLFYAAAVHWLLVDDRILRRFTLTLFCILMLVMLDTWLQYFVGTSITGRLPEYINDYTRLTGPLFSPNIGNYLLKLLLPALALLLLVKHNKQVLIAAWFLTAGTAMLIPLTGERSITLLLLLAGTVVGCTHMVRERSLRLVLLLLIFVAFTIALGATQEVVKIRAVALVQDFMYFHDSNYGQLFKTAWYLWQESPLVGSGLGKFEQDCNALRKAHGIIYCDRHAHNIYLHVMAELGLIGFIALLALAGTMLWSAVQNIKNSDHRMSALLALAGVSVLFFPFVGMQNMFSNWPAQLFWLTLTLLATAIRSRERGV